MVKDKVMAYFKVLSLYFFSQSEENHKAFD
jgi:hypothetical protein